MRVGSAILNLLSCFQNNPNCTVEPTVSLTLAPDTKPLFNAYIAEHILENLNPYLDIASTMNLGKVSKAFRGSTAAVNKLAHDEAFKVMQLSCPESLYLHVTNSAYSLFSQNVKLMAPKIMHQDETVDESYITLLKKHLMCINSLTTNLQYIKDQLNLFEVFFINDLIPSRATNDHIARLLRGFALLLKSNVIKSVSLRSFSPLPRVIYDVLRSSNIETLIIDAPLGNPQHFKQFARRSTIKNIEITVTDYLKHLHLLKNLERVSLPMVFGRRYPKSLFKLKRLTGIFHSIDQVPIHQTIRKVVDELTIDLRENSNTSVAKSGVKLKSLTLLNAKAAHATFLHSVLQLWIDSLVSFEISVYLAFNDLLIGNSVIKSLSVSYVSVYQRRSETDDLALMREMTFGYLEHAVSLESLSISMLLVDADQFLPLLTFISTHYTLQKVFLIFSNTFVEMQHNLNLMIEIIHAVARNPSINALVLHWKLPCADKVKARIFLADFVDATQVLGGRNLTFNGVPVEILAALRTRLVAPYQLLVSGILTLKSA